MSLTGDSQDLNFPSHWPKTFTGLKSSLIVPHILNFFFFKFDNGGWKIGIRDISINSYILLEYTIFSNKAT